MYDEATVNTVIEAAPGRVFELASDFESYPDWASDIKEARVLSRDTEGRPLEVAYRAAAMGRSTSYTLRYDYDGAPGRIGWVLVSGDITRRLDGWYRFDEVDDRADHTQVTYHLEVDLKVPLPGFIKRRAEGRIMHTALDDLKRHAER